MIRKQRLWSTNYPFNVDSGVEFYGTKRQLFLSRRGKAQLLGERNRRIDLKIKLQPQDAGINWIDTAATYGNGQSEAGLGRALRDLGAIDNIHIATKVRLAAENLGDIDPEVIHNLVSSDFRSGTSSTPRS